MKSIIEEFVTPDFIPSNISGVSRYHYTSIDSTQLEGRRVGPYIAPNTWYLCTASEQTGGIGQHDRKWVSPEGVNVYATFGFTSAEKDFKKLLCIPHITVLSVLQTLEEFGVKAKFKWVNDSLVNGKKISGILVENIGPSKNASESEEHNVFLVGIGINVNLGQDELLKISQPAISMYVATGDIFNVEKVVNVLAYSLHRNVDVLLSEGFSTLHKYLAPKLEDFHEQPIIFDREYGEMRYLVGKISGLYPEYGQLIVQEENGESHKLTNGRILKGLDIKSPLEMEYVIEKLVKIHYFEELDSTQLYARKHLDLSDDMYWHAVVTDYQTNGIGSADRKWHGGIKESVLATYILPYFGDLTREQLSQVVSISVKDTLDSIGCPAKIKWLNDVICNSKKVSGNLVEIKDHVGGKKVCLIGVGININQTQENFDQQNLPSATSVKLIKGVEDDLTVKDIFSTLTKNLYYHFQIAVSFGYQKVKDSIETALAHLKHKVEVLDKTTDMTYQGTFTAMSDNGSMILTFDEGNAIEIMNGSIVNDLGLVGESLV